MEDVYKNPELPASFGGVENLYRAAKGKVKRSEIKNWLEGVDAYTLHKPIRRKFPTNRVIVYSIDQQWQADLADLSNLQKYNNGYRYILTCIDILSKYAWAIPLKSKRGDEIVEAFRKIFMERKPQSLQTDQGMEFKNSKFQSFLKDNKVRFFTTFNNTKSSIVERLNRTIKTKMWKYFTANNTYRYLDVLPQLLKSYNSTYHSSIKRSPSEVNSTNESDVWYTLYGEIPKPTKCIFKIGDTVRISRAKLTFEKGYTTNWTDEIFVITQCVRRSPSVYRVKDLLGESILGTFYPQELQKVKMNESFIVEKIIKKREKGRRIEYFVKYRGYPDKFNQWIPASDLSKV